MQPIHGVRALQRESKPLLGVSRVARVYSSSILPPRRIRRPIVDPMVEIADVAAPIEDVKGNGNDQIRLADQWLTIRVPIGFCLGDHPYIKIVFGAVGGRRKKA